MSSPLPENPQQAGDHRSPGSLREALAQISLLCADKDAYDKRATLVDIEGIAESALAESPEPPEEQADE